MHLKYRRRRGFTLIELLVVLAIIVVLMALTGAAVMRFRGVGLGQATKTNLGKVNSTLNDQWKAVTDGAHKDSLSAPVNNAYATTALTKGGGTNLADEKTRKAYVGLRQVQAFPTNFNEAFWPDTTFKPNSPQQTAPYAWSGYVAYLAELGVYPDNELQAGAKNTATWNKGATAIPLDVQASVCLLMIMQKGPKNTGVTDDSLGSAANQVTLPTGFNPARGILDAWQKPVVFTRPAPGAMAFSLRSAGKDQTLNTADDVVVSNP